MQEALSRRRYFGGSGRHASPATSLSMVPLSKALKRQYHSGVAQQLLRWLQE
jgi:hypothetical protein